MEPLTDWDTYRQTALDMLRGLNPSLTPSNSAPPIVSFLIIPLAVLPRWVGYVLGAVIMLFGYYCRQAAEGRSMGNITTLYYAVFAAQYSVGQCRMDSTGGHAVAPCDWIGLAFG